MINWNTISNLSNGRIVASTAIWIFIVPLLLKANNFISEDPLIDSYVIPSSFIILYFSAVAFFLGATVYKLSCPPLLNDYKSYSDFVEKKSSPLALSTYINGLNQEDTDYLFNKLNKEVPTSESVDIDSNSVIPLKIGKYRVYLFKEEYIQTVFWIIHNHFMSKRKVLMFTSLMMHIFGVIGLLSLFFSNFKLVLNSI